MGGSRVRALLLWARMRSPLRRMFGHRSVFRRVQGVGLWMPWSHQLPDYAAFAPDYGQNLVELAVRIAGEAEAPLRMIDVGANIGDSALQILARVDARVLAVEADPYYLGYLRRNVGDRSDVTIAPILLSTTADRDAAWAPTRQAGTAHFVQRTNDTSSSVALDALPSVAAARIPQEYPAFDQVRLIKSDTDGYDTSLIPELAETFQQSRPVLFFEYDPALTARVAGARAEAVWPELAELGYGRVGFWDNAGAALGAVSINAASEFASGLLAREVRADGYLDVVVVHKDDPAGWSAVGAIFDHIGE